MRRFSEEYYALINCNKQSNNELNLLSALQQLHFIKDDIPVEAKYGDENYNNYRKLQILIKDHKCNLAIVSKSTVSDDIHKNLFIVCCAILNLRPIQKAARQLDDNLLRQYLEQVHPQKHQA